MELLGVRPYRSGDRIRDLHAKSWARIGAPVVREYQQEYFTRVAVIVDTDATVAGARALEAAVSLAAGIVTHLSRGEALIDLLVTGEPLCPLTVGRSLGSPEQALDHLACVEAGPPFDAEALLDRLSPYLPQLSAVVLVALGWDGSRRVFAERVQSKGPGCRVVTLQDGPVSGHGDPTFLPRERVESGRAIRL